MHNTATGETSTAYETIVQPEPARSRTTRPGVSHRRRGRHAPQADGSGAYPAHGGHVPGTQPSGRPVRLSDPGRRHRHPCKRQPEYLSRDGVNKSYGTYQSFYRNECPGFRPCDPAAKRRREGHCPGGESQRGKKYRFQRADRHEAAHGKLAGQDGGQRPGKVRLRRTVLHFGGSPGHLLPYGAFCGGRDRAEFSLLRKAGRGRSRMRRLLPGTQPESGPPDHGDLLQGRRMRQPDG